MKKVPRIEKKIIKEKVLYLFKGEPGVYGKNRKQSKAEDFIKIRYNTNIPSIPIVTSTKIYIRDKEKSFLYKNALVVILLICIVSTPWHAFAKRAHLPCAFAMQPFLQSICLKYFLIFDQPSTINHQPSTNNERIPTHSSPFHRLIPRPPLAGRNP